MDAGLAAIGGALVGAVGAFATAWVGSHVQWKSARLSARAEHIRQRHESREASYKALLSAVSTLQRALHGGPNHVANWLSQYTDDYLVTVEAATHVLLEAVEDIEVRATKAPTSWLSKFGGQLR